MSKSLIVSPFQLPVSLGATGSIDAYIGAAQRVPMLSEQEELDLARRFREHGDLDAARQLVMSHLRLVISIARGYLGYGLPHADLIQEGNIGLMKAVKRFDPERGVRLVSFAVHWIKAEIHEFIIKNWRLVKIATTKAQRKLFFNLRSLKHNLSALNVDEVQDVARDLGVKEYEVVEMETRLGGTDVSLNGYDDDEKSSPATWLAADDSSDPSIVLERRQRDFLSGEGLSKAIDNLDERSREIIRRRWLQDDKVTVPTLHELGREYGVSAERIRQIENKALQRMKGFLSY